MWKQVEEAKHLRDGEEWFYYHERLSHGGYQGLSGNQAIANLKKGPEREGHADWKYKLQAVNEFARDLAQLIGKGDTVVFIPTSTVPGEAGYDERNEMVAARLAQLRPDITIDNVFTIKQTVQKAHHGGSRNIWDIRNNLNYLGFDDEPETVWLIDDVVTWGSHFRACELLIREEYPDVTVKAAYWAKTVWPAPENDDDDDDDGGWDDE
jgi:predicted amidophosphoribosyltransferase